MKQRNPLVCLYIALPVVVSVMGFHTALQTPFTKPVQMNLCTENFPPVLRASAFFEDNEIIWGDDEDDDDDLDVLLSAPSSIKRKTKNEKDCNIQLEQMDDTDDSYYEKLFLQVDTMESKYDDDEDDIIEKKEISKEKIRKEYAQGDNEKLDVDWNRLQKEMIAMRKQESRRKRLKVLEDRASLLALRALREVMTTESVAESSIRSTVPGQIHRSSHPIPTLSHSASINYRKKSENDMEVLELEKKLFGQRFRKAFGVYFRLLQKLDEVKLKSKQDAKEMIMEHVAKQVSHQMLYSADDIALQYIPATIHSAQSHLRQRAISTLSLHESKSFSPEELQIYILDDKTKSIQTLPSWKSLPTADLISVLNIRGNMKRGRSPTDRSKVIRKLEESFRLPLF